jgi:hypothetical protein
MNILDVRGSRLSYDFLVVIELIASRFSITSLVILNIVIRKENQLEDFKDLVRVFRDYRRTSQVIEELKASAFAVESPRLGSIARRSSRLPLKCVYSKKHWFRSC